MIQDEIPATAFQVHPYDRGGRFIHHFCDVIETKSMPPRYYLLELRMLLLPGRQCTALGMIESHVTIAVGRRAGPGFSGFLQGFFRLFVCL